MSDKKDNNNNDNAKSSEDYLKQYLNNHDHDSSDVFDNSIKSDKVERASELEYTSFDCEMFPLGQFYPKGTLILVRPATVDEVQAYSMVDDANFHDIVDKMNDVLASCLRIKKPDGTTVSYLDLMDGDRFYAIFLIRELTFQKGNTLTTKVDCNICGNEGISVELNTKNFVNYENSSRIDRFFDRESGSFYFETKSGEVFQLAPPKIGIQKSFTEYIIEETGDGKKKLNMSFLKLVPFTLVGRNNITKEGIRKKLIDFKNMDMDSYQFINSAVNEMKFGIKEVKVKCPKCQEEVSTPMTFPGGASALFVVSDGFDKFIKE